MKRALLPLALLSACGAGTTAPPARTSPATIAPAPARPALRSRLADAVGPLVDHPFGTAVTVTGIVDRETATYSYGTLRDGGPAAGDEARFDVASVSKVLTAARIVSLAHAKTLDLDDPVARHLPGMKLVDRDRVDRASTVTIRDLIRHSSGLPHQPRDLEKIVHGRWSEPDLLRVLTEDWEITLAKQPGDFLYSNTGYVLLGAIVERTLRCSFADCMADYLRELGMTHSTFWPETLGDDDGATHGRVIDNGAPAWRTPQWFASRYALPFTGLWTSTPDLARFGATILAAAKDPSAPLHAMTKGRLGLFKKERLGVESLEHDGSGPGFHAALVIVPAKSAVIAVAVNGGNETKPETRLFDNVVERSYEALFIR